MGLGQITDPHHSIDQVFSPEGLLSPTQFMDTQLQKRLSIEDSRSLLESGVQAAKTYYGSVDTFMAALPPGDAQRTPYAAANVEDVLDRLRMYERLMQGAQHRSP